MPRQIAIFGLPTTPPPPTFTLNMANEKVINYYRIEKAISYLCDNFKQQPDLDTIAANVFMSPYHFQRIFTDWVGISPKKFLQYLTVDFLKSKIGDTENMIEAAEIAGLTSQSRVHDLFIKIEGVTPQQYKTLGSGLEIFYGYHATPFGMCFIAVSEERICALKFIDEEQTRDEYRSFSTHWKLATLTHKPEYTQTFIKRIFANNERNERLQLLIKGTDFQIKVWEALVKIPFGTVATFKQIATMIQQPEAHRAVAGAVAANTILYLIPCHRIIARDGTMGNYHFGKARKLTMIGWEIANSTQE
jgi:AraC family transcriptional regulator, regulatory protein of adaptative response / methylated-DNA-[protein]-cysteine methyltransferase